jgi:predicted permease
MEIMRDVRYGIRVLLKSSGTTLVMLLILGLGIGANTAIFSFVDALYLKALPVERPDEVVKVFAKGKRAYGAGFSYPEYVSLRDHSTSFSSLAAETIVAQLHVVTESDARGASGAFVTANYFSVLGVKPLAGRFFRPDEDSVPDRDAVAVISAEMWKNRFGNYPAVIGRRITVNRVELQVIGVAPPEFHGMHVGNPEELWLPSMMLHLHGYGCTQQTECRVFGDLIGRLAPNHRRSDAEDELRRNAVWSASDWPKSERPRKIAAFPAIGIDPDSRGEFTAQMRLLMCVAAVLLLVSCANLAGLFLARSVVRGREVAVRLSIGASRARITRQLMTESLLLSLGGCAVGLGFSLWGRNVLAGFYNVDSEGFRHLYDLGLDWRVLVFSFGVAILTGVLFGLLPAIRATRRDLVTQLKERAGSPGTERRGWLRQALVSAQVALSLVLLVSAGLMVRSSRTLLRGTNFDPEHVALLRIRPELLHYTPQQNQVLFSRIPERLKTLPGVEAATFVRGGEGLMWNWENGREVQMNLPGAPSHTLEVRHQDIGVNFFGTLKIPLIEGRDFSERDDANAPLVVIVNSTLARQLWPNASAVGRTVAVNGRLAQVAGVAADMQPANSLEPPAPHLFLPFWQSDPTTEGDMRLALRVKADPNAALDEIRRAIHAIDPNIPIGEDMSMTEQMGTKYLAVRLLSSVISYCGIVALSLSAVGLFSVLTYYVRTRTHEIGVRMALGAQLRSVVQLIVSQGIKMSLTGVFAGLLLAFGATQMLAHSLYGVRRIDLLTFLTAALLLLTVALAASYLPARRAAQVDPVIALRQE